MGPQPVCTGSQLRCTGPQPGCTGPQPVCMASQPWLPLLACAHLGALGTGREDEVADRRVGRAVGDLVVADRPLGPVQWRAAVVAVLLAAAVRPEVARHLKAVDGARLGLHHQHEDGAVAGVVPLELTREVLRVEGRGVVAASPLVLGKGPGGAGAVAHLRGRAGGSAPRKQARPTGTWHAHVPWARRALLRAKRVVAHAPAHPQCPRTGAQHRVPVGWVRCV